MTEIDVKAYARGKNARRSKVSVISPSSMPPSELIGSFDSAFQEDAFQDDAFQMFD